MDKNKLIKEWLKEEEVAHIHGWDFSHINDRYEENDLPWNYWRIIQDYLTEDMQLLDIDTGGGEFLLSLGHPYQNMSATEAYMPNVELCKNVLLPLGINFKEGISSERLPFGSGTFDIIINRHGDYNPTEINRLLKKDGIFIMQQVGAENDRELVELILNKIPQIPFPEQYLKNATEKFEQNGFEILNKQEAFRPIKFYDVGALVWFAHIIEWEFPNFTVKDSLSKLFLAQELIEKYGYIEGKIHRYLIVAKKLSDL